ncbi:MAG TPA: hypothetical protein VGN95_19275 [Pyrinomonadaceae bacterium]|jgi:hypothetical protein|nr:hypothetical protein [Pyrinomonadaceae bacterium]
MNISVGSTPVARHGERGAARLKFIVVLAVVVLVAYMGFQYVPVAFQAYQFKKVMDDNTEMASAGGKSVEWLKSQIRASANDYSVPPDSLKLTEPVVRDGRIEVTAQFTRPINILPFWTYNYTFEHTAKSSTFFTPK